MSVVIVGAGLAGANAALELRRLAPDSHVTLIGSEMHLPYQRPPLSKKFLRERGTPESLFLRAANFWQDHEVRLILGTAAGKVDVRQHRLSLR